MAIIITIYRKARLILSLLIAISIVLAPLNRINVSSSKPAFKAQAYSISELLEIESEVVSTHSESILVKHLENPENARKTHHHNAVLDDITDGQFETSIELDQSRLLTETTEISYGETITGSIDLAAERDAYTFSGQAGEKILIGMSSDNVFFDPEIRLLDSDGQEVGRESSNGLYVELTQTLSSEAGYSILVGDDGGTNTGQYTIFFQRLNSPANSLTITYGETITGSIDLAAERDAYTFSGQAGEKILIGMSSDNVFFDPEIRLLDLDGQEVGRESSNGLYVELTQTLSSEAGYSILVGDDGGTNTGQYTLNLIGPSILGVEPNVGGNRGYVTVRISGAGFQNDAEIRLVRDGAPDIVGIDTTVSNDREIVTRFALADSMVGLRDVVITQDSGQLRLQEAFSIEEYEAPNLWVDITARSPLRVGQEEVIRLEIGNRGNVDLYDLLLNVTLPISSHIRIDAPFAEIPGVDRDDIPLGTYTDSGIVIPIWLYRVGANSSSELEIKVLLPVDEWQGGESFEIKTTVKQQPSPFSRSGNLNDIETSSTYQAVRKSLHESMEQVANEHNVPLSDSDFVKLDKELGDSFGDALLGAAAGAFIAVPIVLVLIEVGATWALALAGLLLLWALLSSAMDLFDLLTDIFEDLLDKLFPWDTGRSWDPNDKVGPTGVGVEHFILPDQTLKYVIYFENVYTATASAQNVLVQDSLSEELDWNTLKFIETSHSVTITTDVKSRTITWLFIDIELPPNNVPPEGEGWIVFTIQPVKDISLGTHIRNSASIVFDANPPITTPEWVNIIGIPLYLPLILNQ